MYPPVALNQYTLVNRTHKHYIYIYASRPHKHLKITPKLNNMQNMEVIWWIFFQIFVSFWGVLGKRMLNPEVLKCHEDIMTLDTYVQQGKTMVTMAGDNKFYIYVKILTSLAIWGPGGGGGGGYNQTGPILVHIYPLFNNNLHVKYRSNLIRTFWVKIKKMKKKKKIIFFGVMLGPCMKSRGTRGTKMSANADLTTVETYVQQGETIWKPVFHLWAKM